MKIHKKLWNVSRYRCTRRRPAPFPPLLTVAAAPKDVEHAVGRRGEAHGVARGGGRAGGKELRPLKGGRIEPVEVVEVFCGERPEGLTCAHARAQWRTRTRIRLW
jgi:hypothetical protein